MAAFKGAKGSGDGETRRPDLVRQRESAASDERAPQAASSVAPPIDLDHLRRYTFGDDQLEREMLELFLAHAPRIVTEMRSADSEEPLRRAAHNLKGSALAVGAWDIARRAEQLEACAARHGEAAGVLEELEHAIARTRWFIASRLRHV